MNREFVKGYVFGIVTLIVFFGGGAYMYRHVTETPVGELQASNEQPEDLGMTLNNLKKGK